MKNLQESHRKMTTLNQLLEKVAVYHPHYDDRLATHLPMVLIALKRLNASNNKLESTFISSVNDLDNIGSLDNIVAIDDIASHLGDSKKYHSYLKYFIEQINIHGVDGVLKTTLPLLIDGLAASAFHALIRLAYAVEENNNSEIAIALAFWSTEFQLLPLSDKKKPATLAAILEEFAPLGENHQFSPGIIVDKMDEIGKLLQQKNSIIQPDNISFDELRNLAITAFNAQNNFTLLHTVTGCHALSIIMPYLEDGHAALRQLWKAILVAYLSTGLSYKEDKVDTSELNCDFTELVAQAIKSNDFHAIKLVYSCFCEYQKHQNPLYYIVAKRAVSAR